MTLEQHDPIPQLTQLRRERLPERDLWPGISRRLVSPWRRRLPLALAASLVAGLVALLTLQGPSPEPVPDSAAAAMVPTQLSWEARTIIEANLAITDEAERQVRTALADRPDSAELQALLALARRKQDDLRKLLS